MLQKNYAHRKCGLYNQSCVLEYRPFGTGHHFPPYTALGNKSIAAFLLAAGTHDANCCHRAMTHSPARPPTLPRPVSTVVIDVVILLFTYWCDPRPSLPPDAHCRLDQTGPHAYYGANSESGIGPDACFGNGGSMTISTWPDMQRPLGAPQGDLKNTTTGPGSWALTRVFGSGGNLTKVAMSGQWSCIWWSDGAVTTLGKCPPPSELFADWSL